jgi:hypothetical protein
MSLCPWCTQVFVPSGRRRYCSNACRQAAYRARDHQPGPPSQTAARPEATVYECPSCEQRYLGLRRCESCNLFCRRVGRGGLCPHCDEPVAHTDLAG